MSMKQQPVTGIGGGHPRVGQRRLIRQCDEGHVWPEIKVRHHEPSRDHCPWCHGPAVRTEWRGRGGPGIPVEERS